MASANIFTVENPPDIEYTDNNQGGKDLRCLNYLYYQKTCGKKSSSFVCTGKGCYASISLKTHLVEGEDTPKVDEPFVFTNLNLKHKENCLPKSDDQFTVREFLQKVKKVVSQNPLLPTHQIYESQRAEERSNSLTTMPDFVRVKDRFFRTRASETLPNPNSLSEVVVSITTTKDGSPFLIHDNHQTNRILVFASQTGLKMLSESERWHADGTFHTKSKYFGQLYTIHAYFPSKKFDKDNEDQVWVKRMIPCVWAYMKRRRTKDYLRVLDSVKIAAFELGFTLGPIQVMIDFELAAKKAFQQIFQQCIVKGCLFHFGQSLFKKFCAIGLKNDYLDNDEVQVWFKSIFCLALIPTNNIEQQFAILSNQMRYAVSRHLCVRSKGNDFLQYYQNTYLNGHFSISMWNHYDNHEDRTNNRVEGDNNKMKLFCGAANPKIDKAVGLLQQYEVTAKDKYDNAKKENAKAPPQKTAVALREANFGQARRFHRDGKLSFSDYFATILDLHKFEPKKKYIEQLEDTDVSDGTSISDSSHEDDNTSEKSLDTDNRPVIDEAFREIESSGDVDGIRKKLNDSTLEEDTRTYHTLEPRRNSEEHLQRPQFTDQDDLFLAHSTSSQASIASTQDAQGTHVTCDLCSKRFTKRGITKHRNACIKKQSNNQLN